MNKKNINNAYAESRKRGMLYQAEQRVGEFSALPCKQCFVCKIYSHNSIFFRPWLHRKRGQQFLVRWEKHWTPLGEVSLDWKNPPWLRSSFDVIHKKQRLIGWWRNTFELLKRWRWKSWKYSWGRNWVIPPIYIFRCVGYNIICSDHTIRDDAILIYYSIILRSW